MRKILALTSALLLATTAMAQEATETTENAPVAEAQTQAQGAGTRASTPQEITRAVHGSWQIRCVTVEPQQCFLYQLIVNEQNSPLAEYSLIPAKDETGEDVKMVGTVITPLNVVLGRGLIMQIDENDPKQQPYGWCAPIGCFSRFPVTGADVEAYKSGSKMTAVIFMMQNPNQGLEIPMPLDGFGAAYDELLEIEAEMAAKAE